MFKYIFLFFYFSISILSNGAYFWGIDSKSLSLSISGAAKSNNYNSTYYNSSRLGFINSTIGIGFGYVFSDLTFHLNDNRSEENFNKFNIKDIKKDQKSFYQYHLGFNLPIYQTKEWGIGVGFITSTVEDNIAKISVYDEKIYQYYKYNSNLKTVLMNYAIGIKLFKVFGIGFGISQLVSVEGRTSVMFQYDDENGHKIEGKDLYLGVLNKSSYSLSLSINNPNWGISIVYKEAVELPYKIPASIILKNFNGEGEDATLNLLIKGIGVWLAPQLNLSFYFSYFNNIDLFLTLSYQKWSDSPKPYSTTIMNSDANLLLVENLNSYQGKIEFRDTINISVGAKYKIKQSNLYLGFQYKPSVIKNHNSYTNYVDNDTISISGGVKYYLWKVMNKQLFINLSFAYKNHINKTEFNNYYLSNVKYGGGILISYIDFIYE